MMIWNLFCSVINYHNIPLPLHRKVLQCRTPVSSHLPWSSSESQWLDFLLSPYRASVMMLQDSLYITDCYFAPASHRHTSLQRNRSPKSIGGLPQGHWRSPWPDFHWQANNNLQNTRLSLIRNVRRKAYTKKKAHEWTQVLSQNEILNMEFIMTDYA